MEKNWLTFVLAMVAMLLATPNFAAVSDFPEADPRGAYNADTSKNLWGRPGQQVIEAKSWPITRATITIYKDSEGYPNRKVGFLTLTHTAETGEAVTFYYNFFGFTEPRAIVSFSIPDGPTGMWEDAFLGITPQNPKRTPGLFASMPRSARVLWVQKPGAGYLAANDDGKYFLVLLQGGEGFSGSITLPLQDAQHFTDVEQNKRKVEVWGAYVLPPAVMQWTSREDPRGHFEWKPGMKESVFRKDKVSM